MQSSRKDLENFLKWIQEAETTVNVLADASQRENALQDTVLAESPSSFLVLDRVFAPLAFVCGSPQPQVEEGGGPLGGGSG